MPTAAFNNPHDISTTINLALTGGTTTLQFPEDRPKYYTELSFTTFSAKLGGGTGFADIQALQNYVANLPTSSAVPQSVRSALSALITSFQSASQPPSTAGQTSGGSIYLPLPVDLFDVHEVRWDEKPIFAWGRQVDVLGGVLTGGLTTPSAVMGLAGLAPNDFQTILFDRPMYKRHELKFKLSPRTQTESDSIRDIITELHNHTAPGTQGVMFTFPDVVQVKLWPHDGYLYKFKPAVIESIGVNYVGGGVKAFYRVSTAPESVELTIRIWETEYWLTGQFTNSDS